MIVRKGDPLEAHRCNPPWWETVGVGGIWVCEECRTKWEPKRSWWDPQIVLWDAYMFKMSKKKLDRLQRGA